MPLPQEGRQRLHRQERDNAISEETSACIFSLGSMKIQSWESIAWKADGKECHLSHSDGSEKTLFGRNTHRRAHQRTTQAFLGSGGGSCCRADALRFPYTSTPRLCIL